MLRRVVAAALRRRRAALAGLALAAAVGFAALPDTLEQAVVPPGAPVLQVRTAAPNLSADDVERLVSGPLERDLQANVAALESVRSTSRAGFSTLDLKFRAGSSVSRDLDAVAERLARAGVPGTPQLSSPADRLSWVGVHTALSPTALTQLVDGRIRPALLGVAGVSNVWLWGESEPLLVIEQLRGVNADSVTAAVQQRLAELSPALPLVQFDPHVYRAADYLHTARHEVGRTLAFTVLALILALAVLLLDWRRTVLTVLAVPIPVLAAWAALRAQHSALDAMTLTGLAAVIPLILFDAVVLSEIGVRARRERAGDPVARLTTAGCRLTRAGALLAVTLLPALFLAGLPERPFLPRAAGTFAVGLAAIAATALLVVPALLGALPGRPARSPARRALRVTHQRVLWPLARPTVAVVVLGALLATGAVAATQVATHLRPSFADHTMSVRLQAWPGSDPAGVSAARDRIADRVRTLPGVREVTALPDCAAAPSDDEAGCADLVFTLAAGADQSRALADVRGAVAAERYGMFHRVDTLLDAQLAATHHDPRAALVVRVSGDDRAALGARAETVRAALAAVPGVLAPAVAGSAQVIEHRGTVAVLDVEAGISGRDHDAVRADVRRALARLTPAVGTDAHLLDPTPDRHRVVAASLAIGAALLLFLVAALGLAGALLVGLVALPAVLGAGIVGLWIDGSPLTPGGLAGLLVLGGLLLRVALLLVPDLQRAGADPAGRRAAAGAHAVPMLQAFGVLALGAVPLLAAGRQAGTEELHPFAAVVCAGLPGVALISVLVLPGLVGLRGGDRKRGPGSPSPGPIGSAEAPMSVSRWVARVDPARPTSRDSDAS
ncbi:MAG TPA: efflux RND transporter permease subunit [Sporichthyaceae bacterium]